jgi:hypothetical protein
MLSGRDTVWMASVRGPPGTAVVRKAKWTFNAKETLCLMVAWVMVAKSPVKPPSEEDEEDESAVAVVGWGVGGIRRRNRSCTGRDVWNRHGAPDRATTVLSTELGAAVSSSSSTSGGNGALVGAVDEEEEGPGAVSLRPGCLAPNVKIRMVRTISTRIFLTRRP